MKNKILVLIIALLSSAFLCSFSPICTKKENYYLQNVGFFETFSTCSRKSDSENTGTDGDSSVFDEALSDIFSEFSALLPEGVPSDIGSASGLGGIGEVVDYILSVFERGDFLGNFCLLFGVALLFALAELLTEDAGEAAGAVRAAASIILSLPVLSVCRSIITSVSAGIASGAEFFSGVIPLFTTVAAIGAGGLTAGAAGTTMSISLAFVSDLLLKNLFPLATLIFCTSILSGVDTGGTVGGVAKGVRGWFNFLIGLSSVILAATFAAQTVITASRESLAMRSAKYAVSGMIPIVGSVVSGSLSMLASGVKLLSGSMGVLSVIALLSFMGAPLITLLFYRFCLGACITVTSFSASSAGERFFSSVRGAVDCLIAVLASSLLVFIMEITVLAACLGGG